METTSRAEPANGLNDPGPPCRVGAGGADDTWLTGGGQFLITTFGYRRALYRDNDVAVSEKRRNDNRFRGRLTYGMPLRTVIDFEGVPEDLKDATDGWIWTLSAEVLQQYSNIINYQYQNRRFQTMLMRRWDF